MIRLLLVGACGRMGREVTARAGSMGFQIVAGVDVRCDAKVDYPLFPSLSLCDADCDVMVDFSRPEGLRDTLDFAVSHGVPLLLAPTGYQEQEQRMIRDASKQIAIFQSANMSLGIQVLKTLSAMAARMLEGYDIEIIERHHNQKLDAPSGTALSLLEAVKNDDTLPVFGRCGRTQKRETREIGVHAVRGGTVAGMHEVGFYGPDEIIQLSHTAQSRGVFAAGALRAAAFLSDKPAGLYGMDDLTRDIIAKA